MYLSSDAAAAARFLERGKADLQGARPDLAVGNLRQALQHPATCVEAHNLIEAQRLDGAFSTWMGCNCEIAPNDDIFRFFGAHPLSINPLRDYLADGWRTMAELMVLMEEVDRPLLKTRRLLEFASGHGRFTRHLVKTLGPQRVTVSDVVADAVHFAQGAFGVDGVVSASVPEQLVLPEAYDTVFVLSLFSHLPRTTWARWLRRLYASLAPGGLLIFTTHGEEAARRQQVTLDRDGFFFAAASESHAIDAAEYGTAFTSEAFVRARVADTVGGGALIHVAPVHFWHHQDAYVLRRPHGSALISE